MLIRIYKTISKAQCLYRTKMQDCLLLLSRAQSCTFVFYLPNGYFSCIMLIFSFHIS